MKKLFLIAVAVLLFQSCGLFRIKAVSGGVMQSLELPGGITLRPTGVIEVMNKPFNPASFRIDAAGKVIYVDPAGLTETAHADYVFITHTHTDHFNLPDIDKVAGEDTLIVCPAAAARHLSGRNVRTVGPGESFELDGLKCETVAAYNLKPVFLNMYPHPAAEKYVGYVFDFGGVRIYHAGDTDFVPEMGALTNLTVALVPVSGDGLTMNAEQAAEFVNAVRPEIAVPMHYSAGATNAALFAELVDEGIRVMDLFGEE